MKAHDFKALSLSAEHNSINAGDFARPARHKYQPVPAYRGLKSRDRNLQNTGQMANAYPAGSAQRNVDEGRRHPLWQLAPRGKNGDYPRSRSLPNMPTFEEFYASVTGGKPLAGDFRYQAMRTASDPQLAMFRVAVLPPKASGEAVTVMRAAFDDLWKDEGFLSDYARVLATRPIMVSGGDGQQILVDLGKVPRKIKDFLIDYTTRITEK